MPKVRMGWRGRHVGIVFQFFQFLPTLTAAENVLLALQFGKGGGLPRRRWRARAFECLELAGIADFAEWLPGQLSGGQQQRIAIARARANDPPVLVADEPTGNLDSHSAQQVFDTLASLTEQGKTVVYVTHDPRLAARASAPLDVGSGFMIGASDHSAAAVNAMANRLDDMLARAGLSPSISTRDQQIARNQGQFQILYILLDAVAAIVALVGLLGLFNTLTTSVLERRREIGILRSMGATSWHVASVFWTEGMALAGISWVVGVVLGIPAAYDFVALLAAVLLPLPFVFSPAALAAMLLFTLVLASLASILPVLSATRVRVAETLRYE